MCERAGSHTVEHAGSQGVGRTILLEDSDLHLRAELLHQALEARYQLVRRKSVRRVVAAHMHVCGGSGSLSSAETCSI